MTPSDAKVGEYGSVIGRVANMKHCNKRASILKTTAQARPLVQSFFASKTHMATLLPGMAFCVLVQGVSALADDFKKLPFGRSPADFAAVSTHCWQGFKVFFAAEFGSIACLSREIRPAKVAPSLRHISLQHQSNVTTATRKSQSGRRLANAEHAKRVRNYHFTSHNARRAR